MRKRSDGGLSRPGKREQPTGVHHTEHDAMSVIVSDSIELSLARCCSISPGRNSIMAGDSQDQWLTGGDRADGAMSTVNDRQVRGARVGSAASRRHAAMLSGSRINIMSNISSSPARIELEEGKRELGYRAALAMILGFARFFDCLHSFEDSVSGEAIP